MRLVQSTPNDYRRTRWHNGAGATAEIARFPMSGEASLTFDWRASLAEIDHDAEFSRFPGYDRTLLVISGDGIELVIGDDATRVLDARAAPFEFAGDPLTRCRLLGAPTRALNVFVRRGAVAVKLLRRPLIGPMVLLPEAGVSWLVYVMSGWTRRQNDADAVTLQAGDSLLAELDAGDRPIVLNGSGELAIARFERLRERARL